MTASILQNSLKKKLILLYVMNIADWLCTVVLLRTGGFYEANPLMRPFVAEPIGGFLLKGAVPALIILLIIRVSALLDKAGLKKLDTWIAFVLTLYTALCIGHVINFILLFSGLVLD